MPPNGTSMVDRTYLDLAAELLAPAKQAGLAASAWPGARVLDVGSGGGADAVALAEVVGSAGTVDGIDADPFMVAAANMAATAAGVAERVQHKLSRADRIPFADDRFDVARAERVLQHCDDPARVVAEMVRVVRPGGRLVLVDTDWASVSMSCLDPVVERDIARLLLTAVPRPTVGRELGHVLRAAGCLIEDIRPHLIASRDVELIRLITRLPQFQAAAVRDGALAAATDDAWQASCEQLAGAGAFLGYAVITVAIGTVAP